MVQKMVKTYHKYMVFNGQNGQNISQIWCSMVLNGQNISQIWCLIIDGWLNNSVLPSAKCCFRHGLRILKWECSWGVIQISWGFSSKELDIWGAAK
jgi:hypothetical protein